MLYEHWIKLFLIFRMFTLIIFLVGNCQFYFNNDSNTLLLHQFEDKQMWNSKIISKKKLLNLENSKCH
jgi:hypothetical protein